MSPNGILSQIAEAQVFRHQGGAALLSESKDDFVRLAVKPSFPDVNGFVTAFAEKTSEGHRHIFVDDEDAT
jgi:hypothetical protein